MELLAGAFLAEIRSEWLQLEEPQQREELSDAVLYWSSGEAPFIARFKCEAGSGNTRGALLEKGLA